MRIFLNGIGAFGVDALTRLQQTGHQIVAVAAPPQSLSGRPDRLWAHAEAAGIPVFETKRLAEPQVESALRQLTPELGVMAFVQEFMTASTLDLPEHGTIQYHPSLLPLHRGRSAINWAIIQGKTRTGVSIFWPDEGMDTGPVLLQREVEIGPDDTAGSLYRDKLYPIGIDALAEAVALVREGRAPKAAQDETRATYEKPCGDRASRVDWRRSTRDVYNLVRGCDPSPGAWTRWQDQQLRLFDASTLSTDQFAAGEVGRLDDAGMVIGTADGALLVRTLRLDPGSSGPAAQVAEANAISVGTQFESP
jgi:methionyl-tRNA formyltransferase